MRRHAGYSLAAKAVYHAAWQFYGDRWLNIPSRPLSRAALERTVVPAQADPASVRAGVVDAIEAIRVRDVGSLVAKYLAAGHPRDALLHDVALAVLRHDTGWDILDTPHAVFDETQAGKDHPAAHQLIVGLARFTTGARRSNNSDSATRTARRFARRQTAVDLY